MNPTMKIFELKKFKILIACVIIPALFSACENDMEKVKIISGKKAMPAETGKDVEILYSDSAKLKARLLATELNRFVQKPPYIEMPKGIKLYFYDSNQKVNSTLTAQYAKVLQFPDNNIMEARRKVVVVNEKNEKLETEHLIWNQKEETIVSNAYVTITTKDEIIMGDGLESNQSFTKYKIKKMKGTINLKN
jgi:LPS export ABC transporter protein LptC